MSEAVLLDQAALDIRGLLTGLSLGQAVTLADTSGEPVALLVSLRKETNGHSLKVAKAPTETEAWLTQWRELAEAIGQGWPAGQSAADVIAEMRR